MQGEGSNTDTEVGVATPAEALEPPPQRQINEWAQRLRARKQDSAPPPPPRGAWTVIAVIALALLVGTIVVVGLRTSLGALRDAALAAHIERQAASLYWIGVDGLIVVAIIAALVLRHDRAARRYCLFIIAVFTFASGLLQYLHGLGWFTPDRVSGIMPPLPWGVVLVIALLVIGTIFCGTHLFVHALRRLFPGTAPEQPEGVNASSVGAVDAVGDSGDGTHPEPGVPGSPEEGREERKTWAAITVRLLIENGVTLPRKRLSQEYGISPRQVGYVIADVIREREEEAERATASVTALALTASSESASPNGSGSLPEPVPATPPNS